MFGGNTTVSNEIKNSNDQAKPNALPAFTNKNGTVNEIKN